MGEFNYGDPLPLPLNRRSMRRQTDERAAKHFAKQLCEADALYLRGADGVREGLALLDLEAGNIRYWQAWAADAFTAYPDDPLAAEICRDCALRGILVTDLRLHPAEKIRWLEVAYQACLALADRQGERKALNQLGVAWADLGEARKAIEFYEESLVIARETGSRDGEKHTLSNLGNAWAALGNYRMAIEYHQSHYAIAREIGDRRAEGNALNNLGNASASLRDFQEAVRFHSERLTIACEMGDRRAEGQTLNNLGNAWYLLGNTDKAIDFHTRRLVIALETGDRRGEGSARGNLGLVWAARGEHEKALGCYDHHLLIAADTGDSRAEANARLNMALSLRSLGRVTEAISFARTAFELFQAIESPLAEAARLILNDLGPGPSPS